MDSWLIWNLANGVKSGLHLRAVTNASWNGLRNIHTQTWDGQLATFYRVPLNIMHKVLACRDRFGMLELTSLVGVNITGCMGDQQVANVEQCCCTSPVSKVTMKKATSS